MGRRVAVLGATGFLGHHVVERYRKAGHDVAACARFSGPDQLAGAGRRFHHDVLDPKASGVWSWKPEIVVNCAAYGVAVEERNAFRLVAINASAVAALIDLAEQAGVERFIQVGSAVEYGAFDGPIPESRPCDPIGIYARAKAAGSQIALALAETSPMSVCLVRPFAFYGPGEKRSKFVPNLLAGMLAGRSIDLTAGNVLRDYTFVGDVADAILLLSASPIERFRGEVFNICSGKGMTIREFGESIIDIVGADRTLARWGALPARAGELPSLVGDPGRLSELTGWQPSVSLSAGIEAMCDAMHVTHRLD